MAARHPVNERLCPTLNGISAGFAEALAAVDIARNLVIAQSLEPHDAVRYPAAQAALAVDDRNRAQHMVSAAAQQVQETALHVRIIGLRQYPTTYSNAGVAGKDDLARRMWKYTGLFLRHAQRIYTGNFALAGGFVNVGRRNAIWRNAQAQQHIPSPWTGRSQYKRGVQTQGLSALI